MVFVCDYCHKEFEKAPATVLRNKSKCCSVACSKKLIESQKVIKICENCNNEFKVKKSHDYQKCCSKKCATEFRSKFINGKPIVKEGKLLCYRCNTYKDYNEFYDTAHNSKNSKRDNKFKYCKLCHIIVGSGYIERRKSTIEGSMKEILKRTKCVCKKKKIDFNIDIEYLLDLLIKQDGKCALSGQILENSTYYNPYAVSIDRINPNKGYIKENVQLVCWVVNQMKNNLLKDDLIYWCSKIINFNNYGKEKEELDTGSN